MTFTKITKNVYAVGGPGLSNSGDAYSYLIKTPSKNLVLIDCGVNSLSSIEDNIRDAGFNADDLHWLILTHGHIDHIGSASDFYEKYGNQAINGKNESKGKSSSKGKNGLKIIAHEWERDVLEGAKGTEKMTAASWYGIKYKPVRVDIVIKGEQQKINLGGMDFTFIHTPGHTPGSMSVLIEDEGKKIIFPHDVHGPFMREFGSNIEDWKRSMKKLIRLECDILAEGHYGIYYGKNEVKGFIESQLAQHQHEFM